MSITPKQRAEEFLKTAHLFQLGALPTETPHPLTVQLSQLAQNQLFEAYQLLQKVDQQAIAQFAKTLESLEPLQQAIAKTKQQGGRLFLCGCGATGRLSLSLEYLWRRENPEYADFVTGFMAGGDVALVHALEGFEDFPEYGARHLKQLGFGNKDLLIASTEGGETPYVIGATEYAAANSGQAPFFLYCNPKNILLEQVERSRRVLENPAVKSICLFVGPMSLAGSTRMQASTVLMLAIGLCLFRPPQSWRVELNQWQQHIEQQQLLDWVGFTEAESDIYANGEKTLYSADEFAITVMTDTTERAPTFSLVAFDNQKLHRERHSLSYLYMPQCQSALEAWAALLGHAPRSLNWSEINVKTNEDYLAGFDFSQAALHFRQQLFRGVKQHIFTVESDNNYLRLALGRQSATLKRLAHSLWDHLLLKVYLNAHSTLVMGRLGRYEGNLMTYVKPTNGKLIDRATRYVQILARRRGYGEWTYQAIVQELFNQAAHLKDDEPIVLKTLHALKVNRA